DGGDECVTYRGAALAVWQVHEDRVAARTFYEGRDRRALIGPADEIAFPMSRRRSVGCLRRSFVHGQHRCREAWLTPVEVAVVTAHPPACAQRARELAAQDTIARRIQSLVDGLVHDVQVR